MVNDLRVGGIYRGKRYRETPAGNNDRVIIWRGKTFFGEVNVQYDAYTVRDGHNYPTVTAEDFLKWAKEEVTNDKNHCTPTTH